MLRILIEFVTRKDKVSFVFWIIKLSTTIIWCVLDFGHLMQRADSLEKTLMLGGIEGRRRRGWQRMRWLDGITDSMDMSLSKLWELVMDREACRVVIHGTQRVRNDWATELNWECDTSAVRPPSKIGSNHDIEHVFMFSCFLKFSNMVNLRYKHVHFQRVSQFLLKLVFWCY